MESLPQDRAACAARHLGWWMVELPWFYTAIAAVKNGTWNPIMGMSTLDAENVIAAGHVPAAGSRDGRSFLLDESIAVIEISGQMQKGRSKFGGASTLTLRRQIREAARDPEVRGIMLLVDSPGGTVAGTEELARDVRAAAEAKKLRAHVDDMAASAAFWVISPASLITALETSEVGSIGTVAVVEDSSGAAEIEGIKVHVISTGAFKGLGVPGVEVTDEQLDSVRVRVEDLNEHFLAAVQEGRRMSRADLKSIADGRMFIARKAKANGLIDRVSSFDEAMESFRSAVRPRRRRAASARLRLAEEGGG